jgi:hypothetical protein
MFYKILNHIWDYFPLYLILFLFIVIVLAVELSYKPI